MSEDKQVICDFFLKALNFTDAGAECVDLVYNSADESVSICYKNGALKRVNVACDSGIAMIRDILKEFE
ncbi:MAG: hypothetical protein ACI4DU_04470 [Lachnospiraceae bacterium]